MDEIRKEKVVGILGGMGPYATLDFFKKILDLTPAKKDWEHLRMIIDNNVKIPSRTRAILYQEKSPVQDITKSINNLAKIGADFVVLPCNSAHFFYEEVITNIKIPWLNMVQIISKYIKKDKPLILGGYITVKKKLYSKYINNSVYLDDEENGYVSQIIEEVKLTSKLSNISRKNLFKIISKYKDKADSIILACTELPIVIKDRYINNLEIFDTNLIYAQATIDYAKKITT